MHKFEAELEAELIEAGLLDGTGRIPTDILSLLFSPDMPCDCPDDCGASLRLGNEPRLPENVPHLWLDNGGTSGEWVWRRDDWPIYVIREKDGKLHRGSATY